MRKIVTITLLILTAMAGTAAADRDRGHRRGDRHERVQTRDHRRHDNVRRYDNVRRHDVRRHDNRRFDNRRYDNSYRRDYRRDYRYSDRRAVRHYNGHYVFNGGHRVTYRRPYISRRYYDYRVRPVILVENYDTVPGYIW